MAVVIDSGPITATRRRDDIPIAHWRELVAARRDFCAIKLSSDCRELLRFVEDAPEMLEPLGYADVTDFVRRGLELDPAMVTWAIEGLKHLKPDEPIPFRRAIEEGTRAAKIRAAAARPETGQVLPEAVGINQYTDGKRSAQIAQGSQSTRANESGVSRRTQQTLDKLARQAPDVLDAYKAGTYRSVNAAAKAAGFIREKTILEQLQRLWKKATPEERATFLVSVTEHHADYSA